MAIARVEVRNVAGGPEEINVSEADFKVVGSSNKITEVFRNPCGVIPDNLTGKLFEGGRTEGHVCWQIPVDESGLIAIWEPLGSPDKNNRRYLSVE